MKICKTCNIEKQFNSNMPRENCGIYWEAELNCLKKQYCNILTIRQLHIVNNFLYNVFV